MYSNLFSPDSIAELTVAMQTQFPKAIWETFYVTLLSTALAVVIGASLSAPPPSLSHAARFLTSTPPSLQCRKICRLRLRNIAAQIL